MTNSIPTPEQLASFAAVLAQAKTHVDGTPYTILPPGWMIESLAEFLKYPVRPKGTVTFQETDSFVAYVNKYKLGGETAIYCDRGKALLTAVLNDHDHDDIEAGHRDFRAVLPIKFSRQWRAWTQISHQMTHEQFAEFLEKRIEDFYATTGAEMMEIVLNFEARKAASFRSGLRLDNGSFAFAYDEEVRGSTKAGTIEIPSEFTLSIPILHKQEPEQIQVRLRYRMKDAAVFFSLVIKREEELEESAIDAWAAEIQKATEVPMYMASAEE